MRKRGSWQAKLTDRVSTSHFVTAGVHYLRSFCITRSATVLSILHSLQQSASVECPSSKYVSVLLKIWAGYFSRHSDWLWAGWSGDRIPVGGDIFRTCPDRPWDQPASCTMRTGSFSGVKCGRGVTLTPHSLLVPWSWKGRAIPLLPL